MTPRACALLLLVAACDETQTQAGPPPAVPIRPKPAAPSAVPAPAVAKSPWAEARVGDRVEYAYTAESQLRDQDERRSNWKLAVEVVKVEPESVWVAVKGSSAAGKVLGFLVAVAPRVPDEKYPRQYVPAVDGGMLASHALAHCRPWSTDHRKADGPVTRGCDSDAPPFYLLRSLSIQTTGSGFGGYFFSSTLEAVSAARGPDAEAAGVLPKLPVLFAPNAWYRRVSRVDIPYPSAEVIDEQVIGGQVTTRSRRLGRVQRTRKDLTRDDLIAINGNNYALADDSGPVHFETLAEVVTSAALRVDQPFEGRAGKVTIATGEIATVGHDTIEFAADLFDPLLDGLPWSGRVQHLSAGGQLWDWGAGPMAKAPAAAAGSLPDTLAHDEIAMGTRDITTPCAKTKKKGAGPARLQLTLALGADGKPTKVRAEVHPRFGDAKHPPSAAALKCIEQALMKRQWPPFAGPATFKTDGYF